LGDTHHAGFEVEIRHNLIACWPGGVLIAISFALNGSHELFSGGNAYFDLLPLFGRSCSYFNLGNKCWRLVALDMTQGTRNGEGTRPSVQGRNLRVTDDSRFREVDWLAAHLEHAQSFNPPARISLSLRTTNSLFRV
jgi:hypothetical protein